jgi:fatty-acyl-CoA synthase
VVPADAADESPAVEAELRDLVRDSYPDWWAPDVFVFIDEVPKTATGKFAKTALREEHVDDSLLGDGTPAEEPD